MMETSLRKTIIAAALAASALSVAVAPLADAQPRHRVWVCKTTRQVRHAANTGTVVGAVGGGLLGNAVGHGGTGSTLVGAGVGAVAGHQIAKSNAKKKCHWEYRR
jgi:uncharacterized protein YcfJ